jgi:hypothetical protein
MDEEGDVSTYEPEKHAPTKSLANVPAEKRISSVMQSKQTGENTLERMKRLQLEKMAKTSSNGYV